MVFADLNIETDLVLLARIREGSSEAFNTLYKKYWPKVYSDAYKRLKNADQSKDIAQEIFINLWLSKNREIENIAAYLSVAVRNQVFKYVAKQKKASPFVELLNEIPANSLAADANVRWREFSKVYEDLLNSMPPKCQLIFRLRYQQDLTTQNIADQLGISQKTVQNQLIKVVRRVKLSLQNFVLFSVIFFQD